MKLKLTLLSLSFFAFAMAKANNSNPGDGKKDEMNGTVLHSETHKPLKDVSITAILNSKKEKVITTDEDGTFNFDELKPGTYKFVFEKAGYKKITKEKIIIKTDETFQMNIEMIEADSYDITPSPFSFGIGR